MQWREFDRYVPIPLWHQGQRMSDNPYNSPLYGAPGQPTLDPFGSRPAVKTLGGFVLTILILDLVFCAMRFGLAMLGAVGFAMIEPDDPMRPTVVFEVGTGLAIALFGISANILILLKKPIGIYLAVVKIFFTVANMLVGIWQASLQFGPIAEGAVGAERTGILVGFTIGILFVLGFRLTLMGLYIAALVKANSILSE
ncbi:MAG: hypothetical protein EA424_23140 [Planctomycetaceae bacterium]|nr:MAG: hypothetical protein EA424_23140 [Planctomycetaceae bacterium]